VFLTLFQTILLANDWDFLSVNGYGTLGVAYQDNDQVLFRNSFFTQKGTQGDISFDNYGVLGVQLDAEATDKLSFTLQTVMSANNANGKMVDIEWANAKYQLTDTFDIKVGLMRIPIFIYSDILNVAYSYDMLRLPDMYGLVSINKYEGGEIGYSVDFDESLLVSTFLAGQTNSVYKSIDSGGMIDNSNIDAKNIYGLTLKFLYKDLMLRTSYLKATLTVKNVQVEGALNQLNGFNVPIISNTIEKYKVENQEIEYFNIAAKYDFKNSYLMGEYIKADTESFIVDLYSWYLSAGYNFETWTPFVMYSKTGASSNFTPLSTEGVPMQLTGAIMGANQAFTQMSDPGPEMNLETVSLGLRYDLADNAVLKFQYDEQKRVSETLNIFSFAMNLVF